VIDKEVIKGDTSLPAFIFIHGLGMDKNFFCSPEESRILGGLFPLSTIIRQGGVLRTLYNDLRDMGITVATWTQSRPAGPANDAVRELIEITEVIGSRWVFLIGHSRGGLIARAASPEIKGLRGIITISTPHRGSAMAKWALYLSPLSEVLKPLLSIEQKTRLMRALRRTAAFLSGRAVREILPNSEFLNSLPSEKPPDCLSISVGGTDPTLFSIKGISIPGSLKMIVPGNLFPEEMTLGKGDGLVSSRSSVLPFGDEHMNFHLNHAETAFDESVRKALLKRIESIL